LTLVNNHLEKKRETAQREA